MKPILFKEANGTLLGKGDVQDLPVFRDGKQVISCWRIPFWQRITLLWKGRVWLYVRGETHPPVWIQTDCF